jgi:hypothetical protein
VVDALQAVRDFLVAQGALTALTGGRIWAGRDVPPPGYQPADGGAICLNVRGGSVDESDALVLPSVQFKCYGADEVGANEVYRALYDALHNAQAAVVRWARCEILGQTLQEPETGWTFVLAFFQVTIANP